MTTDLERLHHVIESNYGPHDRGVGKTFSHCHELCGVLAVGDTPVVLCRVEKLQRVWHIVRTLEQVFPEHGIKYATKHGNREQFKVVLPDGTEKEVRFIRFDDWSALRGLRYGIVDFPD